MPLLTEAEAKNICTDITVFTNFMATIQNQSHDQKIIALEKRFKQSKLYMTYLLTEESYRSMDSDLPFLTLLNTQISALENDCSDLNARRIVTLAKERSKYLIAAKEANSELSVDCSKSSKKRIGFSAIMLLISGLMTNALGIYTLTSGEDLSANRKTAAIGCIALGSAITAFALIAGVCLLNNICRAIPNAKIKLKNAISAIFAATTETSLHIQPQSVAHDVKFFPTPARSGISPVLLTQLPSELKTIKVAEGPPVLKL